MSKGIGKMQRKILDFIKSDYRNEISYYPGAGFYGSKNGWVRFKDTHILLPDDVHDLRAVLSYLAKSEGERYSGHYVNEDFKASFSRAINGLLKRGYLKAPTLLKIKDSEIIPGQRDYTDILIHNLSDGKYLMCNEKQKRFVLSVMNIVETNQQS